MPLMRFRHVRSERELRAAWRKVARKLHPDANTHDPRAEEHFKAAHAAYGRALRRIRGRRTESWTPPPVHRSRFICTHCNDTFTHGVECPRCQVTLHDSNLGEAPKPTFDAEIADFEAWLERPRREFRNPIPAEDRPLAAALGMLMFGMFHFQLGMMGTAVLFVGFAGFVMALDGYERFRRMRPEAWRSSY